MFDFGLFDQVVFDQEAQLAAASLNYTLTASLGSFALNGQTCVLRKNSKLIASNGSLSISGQSTQLKLNRNLSSAGGLLSLSGQNVNFSLGSTGSYSLSASMGSISITGYGDLLYNPKVGGSVIGSWRQVKPESPHKHLQPLNPLPTLNRSRQHLPGDVQKAAAHMSSMGGHARAEALTPKQRITIATNAAKARWK